MNPRSFVIRLLINAIAITVTAYLLPGITVSNEFVPLLIVAVIFSLVNSIIKPILVALTCPAVILTLGLFILVINGLVLQITAYFAKDLLQVNGLGWAILGGIIIAIVNVLMEGIFFGDETPDYLGSRRPK